MSKNWRNFEVMEGGLKTFKMNVLSFNKQVARSFAPGSTGDLKRMVVCHPIIMSLERERERERVSANKQ